MAQLRDHLLALPADFPYRHTATLLSELGLGRYPAEALNLTPRALSQRILSTILSSTPQPKTAHNIFTDWGWTAGVTLINRLPYYTPKLLAESLLTAAATRLLTSTDPLNPEKP